MSSVSATACFHKAEDAVLAGDGAKAMELLIEALKIDPLHSKSLALQARIFHRVGKLEHAIKCMLSAVLIERDVENLGILAGWYFEAGDIRASGAALKACQKLDPKNSKYKTSLAAIYNYFETENKSSKIAKSIGLRTLSNNDRNQHETSILCLQSVEIGGISFTKKGSTFINGHNNLLSSMDGLFNIKILNCDNKKSITILLPLQNPKVLACYKAEVV